MRYITLYIVFFSSILRYLYLFIKKNYGCKIFLGYPYTYLLTEIVYIIIQIIHFSVFYIDIIRKLLIFLCVFLLIKIPNSYGFRKIFRDMREVGIQVSTQKVISFFVLNVEKSKTFFLFCNSFLLQVFYLNLDYKYIGIWFFSSQKRINTNLYSICEQITIIINNRSVTVHSEL